MGAGRRRCPCWERVSESARHGLATKVGKSVKRKQDFGNRPGEVRDERELDLVAYRALVREETGGLARRVKLRRP